MYDLTDVSFLFPVRIDSVVRLENLLAAVDCIVSRFNTNVYVLEAAPRNNGVLQRMLPDGVGYTFVSDDDPIFHRTRYINMLAARAYTPILAVWDADAILLPGQIDKAAEALRLGRADIAFPYNGYFFDTTTIIRDVFLKHNDLRVLVENRSKMLLPYGTDMGGGAFMISRDAFLKAMGEDEAFYGWGPEDWNRIEKWKALGLRMERIDGPLFHLTHPRDINGRNSSEIQKSKAFSILRSTRYSSADDILSHRRYNNLSPSVLDVSGSSAPVADPVKLNIGCGPHPMDGWLNVDIDPGDDSVMYMDASRPFPFKSDSFDFVYSEHLIEHLDYKGARCMLRESYRTLRPGGIIRIATPSFESLLSLYTDNHNPLNRRYIEWSLSSFSPYVLAEPYSTHDLANIVINNFMHFWGHRMIYTRSTLGSMLRNAGFEEVSFSSVGKSRHLPLQNLERHGQSIEPWANEFETMIVEARKPSHA